MHVSQASTGRVRYRTYQVLAALSLSTPYLSMAWSHDWQTRGALFVLGFGAGAWLQEKARRASPARARLREPAKLMALGLPKPVTEEVRAIALAADPARYAAWSKGSVDADRRAREAGEWQPASGSADDLSRVESGQQVRILAWRRTLGRGRLGMIHVDRTWTVRVRWLPALTGSGVGELNRPALHLTAPAKAGRGLPVQASGHLTGEANLTLVTVNSQFGQERFAVPDGDVPLLSAALERAAATAAARFTNPPRS